MTHRHLGPLYTLCPQVSPGSVHLLRVVEDFIHLVGDALKAFQSSLIVTDNLGTGSWQGCRMWWNPGLGGGGMVSSISLFLEALSFPHLTSFLYLSMFFLLLHLCVVFLYVRIPPASGLVRTWVYASAFLVSASPTSVSSLCLSPVSVCPGVGCHPPSPCSDQHSARARLSCVQRHHVPHARPPGHEGLGAALRGPSLPAQGGAQPLLPREASCLWDSKQPRQGEGPRNGGPWPGLLPPAPPPSRPRGRLLLLCDRCCALPHPWPHPAAPQVSPWERWMGLPRV